MKVNHRLSLTLITRCVVQLALFSSDSALNRSHSFQYDTFVKLNEYELDFNVPWYKFLQFTYGTHCRAQHHVLDKSVLSSNEAKAQSSAG